MAINRFVNVDWDQPISSFVPRPFEAAMLAAKQTQEDLDTKLKALESSTDPFAKLDLSGTIKIYDPTNPKSVNGVVDYDLGTKFEQQKNAIVNNLAQERTKLVNDLYDQKISQNEFDRQVTNNITKSKLAYNSLAEAQNKLKVIRKQNEEVGKNEDFALKGHLGEKYLKYNTDYVKDLESNILREYNPYAIAKNIDRPKEVVEYFDKINPEILASSSGPTGSGYIRTHYREGVTKSKIEKAFTDWYNNSDVKSDILLEGYDKAYREGINPDMEMKVRIPVGKDKSGKIKYEEETMKWIDAFQQDKFNEVKNMAYGFESSSGRDDTKGDSVWTHKDKMKRLEELTSFNSTVVESGAVVSDNIPEAFKKYVDKDGRLSLDNITKIASKEATNNIIIPGYGSRSINDLPKGWYKMSVQNYGDVLIGPDQKQHPIKYDTKFDNTKAIKTVEEVTKEAVKIADRFGLDTKGKTAQQVFDDVMSVLNSTAVNVSKGTDLHPKVSEAITKDIAGTDKTASKLQFVDIYGPSGKDKLTGQEYMAKNDLNPNSLQFMSYDFSAPEPGAKTFSVKTNDGKEEKVVRITTRNQDEQNHFRPAYEVVQNIQKFVQNKDVKHGKDPSGFITIGNKIKNNFDNSTIQAVYKPQRKDANGNIDPAQEYIHVVKPNGDHKLVSLDDYKKYVTDVYYSEGAGKDYTTGISNKMLNIDAYLGETNSEE